MSKMLDYDIYQHKHKDLEPYKDFRFKQEATVILEEVFGMEEDGIYQIK